MLIGQLALEVSFWIAFYEDYIFCLFFYKLVNHLGWSLKQHLKDTLPRCLLLVEAQFVICLRKNDRA